MDSADYSINKTDHHNITKILLKMELKTLNTLQMASLDVIDKKNFTY